MTGIPDAPDLPDFAFLVQPEQFTVGEGEGITDHENLALVIAFTFGGHTVGYQLPPIAAVEVVHALTECSIDTPTRRCRR